MSALTIVNQPRVTLDLSLEQAGKLRALVGQVKGGQLGDLFDTLQVAQASQAIPKWVVVDPLRIPAIFFQQG